MPECVNDLDLYFAVERTGVTMMDKEPNGPGIARIWRGRTTREQADAYLQYWREEGGFHPLAEKALAVQMLREDREDVTEFITVSWWPSFESMSAFAGDDPAQVHHLPRDAEFLIELPERVQILEVVNATWFAPPTGG